MTLYLKRRKRFLKRLILTAMLFPSVFFVYSLAHYLSIRFLRFDFLAFPPAGIGFTILLATFLYKPVDHLVFWFLKQTFLRSNVNPQLALSQLIRESAGVLNRLELANLVVNTLGDVLGAQVVSVLIYEKSKEKYQVVSAFGLPREGWRNLEFGPRHSLIELLKAHRLPLERERLVKLFSWQEANRLAHYFEQLHAACVIPILFENELVATINLTPKEPTRSLNAQEIQLFSDFAQEIACSFHNSMITDELREANQDLRHIQSKFLQSAQHSAIQQLATGIAHEIHNPLTIISGKAQILLLKRGRAYDPQVEEVLKTIVKQTKRASDITRKLLMFADSRKSAREAIHFETLINDTIALLSYQVSLDEIQVIKRLEHPVPKFYGNVGELREAFLNLFLNAVQAIGKRGTIQIDVRHRKQDRTIELRVRDSGPGISEEHCVKLFQPFFTTRSGGTGLGLFVTQQIVHGYGGLIRVESREGDGTTFIVELPVEREQPVADHSGTSAGEGQVVPLANPAN